MTYPTHAVALFVICDILLCVAQNSRKPPQPATREDRADRIRRQLEPAQDMLRARGVPVDLEQIVLQGWTPKLIAALEAMPQMHQSLYVTKPLAGVYLADTLYFPEHIEAASETVIIANHLVFEGKNALVYGNADVHIFPRYTIELLHSSLRHVFTEAGLDPPAKDSKAASLEELARGLRLDLFDADGRYRRLFEPGAITVNTSGERGPSGRTGVTGEGGSPVPPPPPRE